MPDPEIFTHFSVPGGGGGAGVGGGNVVLVVVAPGIVVVVVAPGTVVVVLVVVVPAPASKEANGSALSPNLKPLIGLQALYETQIKKSKLINASLRLFLIFSPKIFIYLKYCKL